MFPIRDHNPSGRTPYVTFALIALNVAVFLAYWPFLPIRTVRWRSSSITGASCPPYVTEGHDLHGILTSMFLHGGWMHLVGNMLFLWIFGDNLEDEMGHLPLSAVLPRLRARRRRRCRSLADPVLARSRWSAPRGRSPG